MIINKPVALVPPKTDDKVETEADWRTVSFRIRSEWLARLDAVASSKRRDRSDYIRLALELAIQEEEHAAK